MRLIALWAMLFVFLAIASSAPATEDKTSKTVNDSSSISELIDFVKEARDYAREEDRESACQEFSNKTGEFVRGDLYIYAYDFQGINVAHPFRPDFIGEDKINLTDPNGVALIMDLADCSRRGEDFTYFIFPNPDHGSEDELKIGYAAKVDENWWVGSGVYLSDLPVFFPSESREDSD